MVEQLKEALFSQHSHPVLFFVSSLIGKPRKVLVWQHFMRELSISVIGQVEREVLNLGTFHCLLLLQAKMFQS